MVEQDERSLRCGGVIEIRCSFGSYIDSLFLSLLQVIGLILPL